jgi:hypothetical protein
VTATVTNDRFAAGETFADYRVRILADGGIMRELLEASERALAAETLDLSAFTNLKQPLRALVLSEDWCGDCTDNLPILNRIAEETSKLDLRIISRDANLDLTEGHLKYGQFQSIPLVIFYDQDFTEIGHFIERPESVTELRKQKRLEIFASNPAFGAPETMNELPEDTRAALQSALLAMRDQVRPFAIQEVIRELSAIATKPK